MFSSICTMADVFISYSRKDKEFVQLLHKALHQKQYDVWVDWEDIPLTADWWAEIQAGIDAADAFVFIITPNSVESRVCTQEIDYAAARGKRMVPILHKEGFDSAQLRPVIGQHNWLFFRSSDDFEAAFQRLVDALETDLEHVRLHTRLLMRAREWQQKQKHPDLLLRGRDLEESERWLAANSNKVPSPTDLHRDFVFYSHQVEMQRQQRERRRLQIFGVIVTGLALVASGLAVWAWRQRQIAIAQREIAYEQREIAREQSKIAFARQLAAAQTSFQFNSSIQKTRFTQSESQIAFGLAALDPDLATILSADQPRLISFSQSQRYVAIITADYGLKAWDVTTGETIIAWSNVSPVVEIGFSPDETLFTSATEDGVLRIWEANGGRFTPITSLEAHKQQLTDTAFSPNGRYLATASTDFSVKIWDLDNILNPRSRGVADLRHGGPVSSVTFSPEGDYLVSASQDNAVRIWTMQGENVLCIIHNQPLAMAHFSNDGSLLGSISGTTLARIWPWPDLIESPDAFTGLQPRC